MAGEEQRGLFAKDCLLGAGIVVAGMAADVGDVDLEVFASPAEFARQFAADLRAIDVAEDAADRFEAFEFVEDLNGPEIAGVPEFIAFGKPGVDRFVKEAVSVGE